MYFCITAWVYFLALLLKPLIHRATNQNSFWNVSVFIQFFYCILYIYIMLYIFFGQVLCLLFAVLFKTLTFFVTLYLYHALYLLWPGLCLLFAVLFNTLTFFFVAGLGMRTIFMCANLFHLCVKHATKVFNTVFVVLALT